MTKRQLLTYAAVTGLIALAAGMALVLLRGWLTLLLLGLGVFFVLFYTWPLKYIALGEICRADRLGTTDDRRRLLRHHRRMGLERGARQPALRPGRDRR